MIKRSKYIVMFLFILILPLKINAETLRDVKNNLADLESKRQENKRLTDDAKNKINTKRNAILEANNTITANESKVEDSKNLVAQSQEQIKIKTEDLDHIIELLQYSEINSNEIFVDYIFSADSIVELMERQAIVQQIANHTQEELESLRKLIVDNEALQVKLNQDNEILNKSITEYEKQVEELHDYIDKVASIGLDYDDQIKAQKSVIKMYEDAGCQDGDNIDECYYSKFTNSTSFSRPLDKGRVTQAWNATHGGIDLGGNTPGTPVYAPASGTVIYVAYHTSCGGNVLYMHNSVNGVKYTTEFAHLRSINVSSGEFVRKGTVIATVGGDSSTWYYDSCTSGAHLHYAISYGYYFTENSRTGWSTFKANTKATGVQSIANLKSQAGWRWTSRY